MRNEKTTKIKLSLKKEILAALDDSEMTSLAGGVTSMTRICSYANDCSRIHEPNTVVVGCAQQ